MASNDMDLAIRQKYIGDFIPIQQSIEKITAALNSTLRQIKTAADEVASDSAQVSGSAQALSQGAREQADANIVWMGFQHVTATETEGQQDKE